MVGPQNGCNRFADSLELRRFYDSTGGNMWQNKTNWISVAPINTLNGIKLNTEGCVLDIRLDQNKLSGTLIDLNLQGLSTLYLPENNISGNLPSFKYLKNLTDLTLNHNMFTGSFPNIDSLKDLVVLGVLDNKLSGPLPILNNNKKIKDLNWGHNNFGSSQ
ncbi:MAG: hypothetical protein IPJ09_05650 [Saprospiraceae bacterium]|nr:hypothetical protein [Saprospiraceae bacterium]